MSISSTGSSSNGDRSKGSSVSYSMFPMVGKTYRVRITEDIERDLRFLGQSRVDALTTEFDMTLVKEKQNLKIYELVEKEFYTMKGVSTVNAPLSEVMQMLRMDSTAKLRDIMGEVFGTLFLDGVVLYKAKDDPSRMNESLSVNWTALQSSKPHLPHRDYVFLRYGDIFEKNAEHGSMYQSNGSGLYIGASIWESIELDGCAPLPASANVVRLRFRRCGIVVEETNADDGLKISFYLSESHPGRASVSSLTKAWMLKMVSVAAEISNTVVARALASQNILTKKQFVKDGICCFICVKAFSMFRRKHHCRVCGDVVCSKCSEMKSLKQGGINKEIRVCQQCRNNSSASVRSSDSDSRTGRSVSSKPSFSNFSVSSSDASNSLYEDESFASNSVTSNSSAPPAIPEHGLGSLSDTNSESARLKTYPSAPRMRPVAEMSTTGQPKLVSAKSSSDMILLNPSSKQASPSSPEAANDMILLGGRPKLRQKDRAESSTSTYSDYGGGVYSMDSNASLTEDEMAAVELSATVRENTPFSYALSYSSRQDWPKAPVPLNEVHRLKKVRELLLVDPGQHFQEMCEYAAAEMGCQIAAICFIGDKSGFLMSKVGLEKRELPRNVLFDSHTIMSEDPTIILDATEDIRFINNPLVKEGKIRFYAGFPLITSDGHIVGSFSVADHYARESLTGDKFLFLKNLAEVAIRGVEQNTANGGAVQPPVGMTAPIPVSAPIIDVPTTALATAGDNLHIPPPPEMNIEQAHLTMQELLRTAYSTQYQVRMQVNSK
ncbi:TPA: hypothetical protein N0F65_005776 [Lagenidium giganteum]|uniref:FYVE-type domain-containing protein n=1 Tax=Lagenidium giganteum TaxID=4803 RepID=A0AAV2YTT4_9STRA|nr:TPA: hypothetical protein N0F65_005776 [Lagenidium giganteum]